MKEIPNKIFIDEDLIVYHCLTDRHDGDLEYIRKSALLEWAKNMKRICKGADPIEKAYQTMIDKIESL